MTTQNGVNIALTRPDRVFPRPFTHGGTSAGGQSVNGEGLMRGDIDLMGDLTLIDYIIN